MSIKFVNLLTFIVSFVNRRLIWSQQNFSHTKTADEQNVVMIELIWKKINTNIFNRTNWIFDPNSVSRTGSSCAWGSPPAGGQWSSLGQKQPVDWPLSGKWGLSCKDRWQNGRLFFFQVSKVEELFTSFKKTDGICLIFEIPRSTNSLHKSVNG